eukprot:2337345-Pyramimonas_sp.AAC.1
MEPKAASQKRSARGMSSRDDLGQSGNKHCKCAGGGVRAFDRAPSGYFAAGTPHSLKFSALPSILEHPSGQGVRAQLASQIAGARRRRHEEDERSGGRRGRERGS